MKKIILSFLLATIFTAINAQTIQLSFIKLDDKDNQSSSPQSSKYGDKLLAIQLLDIENIVKYEEISCIIETKDFHVDEYTFPFVKTVKSQELYETADTSSKGLKYKRFLITVAPDENNTDGSGEFNISFTTNVCGQSYLYSKEGNNNAKEYQLTAKVVGQNYKKVYNYKSEMYDILPAHDPVLLSNVANITIINTDKLKKVPIDLTIGKKSDLFDAINQSNEKVNELNGSGKSKNKK